jgi:hypothetical protein
MRYTLHRGGPPGFIRAHQLKRVEQLLELPLIQSNVGVVPWSDGFGRLTKLRVPGRFALRFERAQMSLDACQHRLATAP